MAQWGWVPRLVVQGIVVRGFCFPRGVGIALSLDPLRHQGREGPAVCRHRSVSVSVWTWRLPRGIGIRPCTRRRMPGQGRLEGGLLHPEVSCSMTHHGRVVVGALSACAPHLGRVTLLGHGPA